MTARVRAAAFALLVLLATAGCEPSLAPTIRPSSGDSYRVGIAIVQKLYLRFRDAERMETVNINIDGDWRFTTVAKGHSADLVFTLSSLSMRKASPGGVVEYAVRTPPGDSATVPSGYTRAFAQFPLSVRLNGAGGLEMVEGSRALLTALRAEPDLANRTDDGELEKELSNIVSDRALADTLGTLFGILPSKKARAGDEWDVTREIFFDLIPVTTKIRLKLRAIQTGQARVEIKTEYSGESPGGEFGSSNLRFGNNGIRGQGGGSAVISLESGIATRVDANAEFRGEVSVYGNPHLDPTEFYPFRMERTVAIHAIPTATLAPASAPATKREPRRPGEGPDFSAPVPSEN
ncbi:MAG: hypothetical protein IT350_11395 [Deltaproteobacteria bacterium]|nr:hypothetical protein [Deltaproteobacteria bacterium]